MTQTVTAQPATQPTPGKPLHIFKPGKWTTMAGETIEFSEADLRASAAAFNPALSKAPIVIGHPATDDPAQGWVASLHATERGLFATPSQVDPAFAQAARAGRYGTVSAKFFRPTDASNPVPGVWYLRHVGMLGAQSPALKGLDDPAFAGSSADDEGVCFAEGVAFGDWEERTQASLWRALREFFIGRFGREEADAVIPAHQVQSLEQAAQADLAPAQATPGPAFSEPTPTPIHIPTPEASVTPEEKAALLQRNTELEAQLGALQTETLRAQAAQRHAAHVAFCEAQPGVLPAWRPVAVATLDHLAAQAEPVQFGEGAQAVHLADQLKALLAALPAPVQFGELATAERAGPGADLTDPEALAARASAYQAKAQSNGAPVSFAHAVAQAARGL